MINKRSYGFTLIELLAVIVVLAIILAIAIPGISGIIKSSTKSSFASDAKMVLKAIDYKKLENENFDPLTITKDNLQEKIGLNGENYAQINFSIVDNKVKVVLVGTGKWNGLTAYGTFRNMKIVNSDDYDEVPPVITILGDNPATVIAGTTYTDAGATANDLKDGNITANIVTTGTVDTAILGTYTITYTVVDNMENQAVATRTVNVIKEGNAPVLAAGMTPIKWGGAAWETTTEDDVDWYNYTTTDKKWANAKTTDGSMWVWIPRYIYKISSGWHTSTVGTIEVKFSIGTDDTRGGTVTLDTGTTANASNNKWTNHPAFTFGTTEITGIWVAKFESSGTTAAIDIKPNVTALIVTTFEDVFTGVRNMEKNSRYGWGTSGTDIDTHLMKNVEWGAVAYLAQSTYGKNAEVWNNNSSTYTTGCAGGSITESLYSGCHYAYTTSNGQQASTTGTIYGIFDMAGGGEEFTAAYINNGHANLATYSNSLLNADPKYKDLYTVGTSDSDSNNYWAAVNKKGDAIYETSSQGITSTAWNADWSSMVTGYDSALWFTRGCYYGSGTNTGVFAFGRARIPPYDPHAFRPVILAGAGL